MIPKVGMWYKSDWDDDVRYYVTAVDLSTNLVSYRYSISGNAFGTGSKDGVCDLRTFQSAMKEAKNKQKVIKKTVSLYV